MGKDRTNALTPVTATHGPRPGALLTVDRGERLLPVDRPDRDTADGYLRLTAHILLASQRQAFRTLGVTSARAREGKTTAAVNLAVCLGRTRGRVGRVLLVDGDVRQRTLSTLLCPDGPVPDPDAETHPRLVRTAFEGVDLMTAARGADDMTLHDPAAWAETLHELRGRYAHIVVDCPAILDDPEGLVLRDCVEELVLVAEAGRTTKRAVERAIAGVGPRVLGVILNGGRPAPR